ncbi:uncharacterized protein G2W53_033839 [Senna tora]|uniref:Uncharacterized protein n=1 Tax=Senna tora TaxID=362788 RepID=A0A834T021_9FABA|nr:uncharacterized protein G2W53_033839 [Senna tora]
MWNAAKAPHARDKQKLVENTSCDYLGRLVVPNAHKVSNLRSYKNKVKHMVHHSSHSQPLALRSSSFVRPKALIVLFSDGKSHSLLPKSTPLLVLFSNGEIDAQSSDCSLL